MSDPFDPESWPRNANPPKANPPTSSWNQPPQKDNQAGYDDPLALDAAPEDDYDPFADDVSTTGSSSKSAGSNRLQAEDDLFNPDDFNTDDPDPNAHDPDDPYGVYGTMEDEEPRRGRHERGEGDYDSYDEFDEFDREPESKSGAGRKILVSLGALIVVAALGFGGWSLLSDSGNAKDATDVLDGGTGTLELPPQDLQDAVNTILATWGQFATTGDFELMKPYLVPDTEQYTSLQVDASEIAKRPPEATTINMALTKLDRAQKKNDNEWILRGTVTVSGSNGKSQNRQWEMRYARGGEKEPWRLVSVSNY